MANLHLAVECIGVGIPRTMSQHITGSIIILGRETKRARVSFNVTLGGEIGRKPHSGEQWRKILQFIKLVVHTCTSVEGWGWIHCRISLYINVLSLSVCVCEGGSLSIYL